MAGDASRDYVCIARGDCHVTFVLIWNGKYAFAQYRNSDVLEPVDGEWNVRDDAEPIHTSVRDAHDNEAVTVTGERYAPRLHESLWWLIAQATGEDDRTAWVYSPGARAAFARLDDELEKHIRACIAANRPELLRGY